MLVTLNDVLKHTKSGGFAVPAFNIFGFADANAVVQAAEELKAPVILATNKVAIAHTPIKILGKMLTELANQANIPVVVHLDHGNDYETVAQAIDAGYSSVMYDGSQLSLKENIKTTREIVKMAHAFSIPVEAEIGSVGYTDPAMGMKETLTDPQEAREFAVETGVDALAVAVGTLHRMEEQTAPIQYDLIKEIESQTDIPLVLHGSTGVADEDLIRISGTNFGKVNIGTALRMAFGNTLRNILEENPEQYDRMELFKEPIKQVKSTAKEKIMLLNTHKYQTALQA